jgi:hypothetical protein
MLEVCVTGDLNCARSPLVSVLTKIRHASVMPELRTTYKYGNLDRAVMIPDAPVRTR